MSPQSFNPSLLREQFPALQQMSNGKPVIFLDGPGGTQVSRPVIEAISDYLQQGLGNQGGAYPISQQTDKVIAQARQAIADFLNASRPEEIIFGLNMTTLTFAMSRAISRTWQPGDEIIVTHLDHDANIIPWTMAAADRGVTVRWLDFRPENCTLALDSLPKLLTTKTRLIAINYASNAVGTINDVAQVTTLAHAVGALVYVDAVHYAPHNPIDVQALDCDFLASSVYKYFGPHVGALYGKYELLDKLTAYKVRPSSNKPAGKWETGTPNFEGLAGVTAAINYLAGLSPAGGSRRQRLKETMQTIKHYEAELSLRFLNGAIHVPGLRVYGLTDIERIDERTPTFAISLEGHTPAGIAQHLGQEGIFVWDGHYYAIAVMERLGLLDKGGLVRIGFVHYNTPAEVDQLLEALTNL